MEQLRQRIAGLEKELANAKEQNAKLQVYSSLFMPCGTRRPLLLDSVHTESCEVAGNPVIWGKEVGLTLSLPLPQGEKQQSLNALQLERQRQKAKMDAANAKAKALEGEVASLKKAVEALQADLEACRQDLEACRQEAAQLKAPAQVRVHVHYFALPLQPSSGTRPCDLHSAVLSCGSCLTCGEPLVLAHLASVTSIA